MSFSRRLRDLPGVLILDLPRYRRALRQRVAGRGDPKGWIGLCNRIERVVPEREGLGVRCDWNWGSPLHAPLVLPSLGNRLLRTALAESPIRFQREAPAPVETPRISFVFAHCGTDRLPQLRQTLRSIFGQRGVDCEYIVVDQSSEPVLPHLPAGVRYRHLPKDGVPLGWNKSWAYNIGARLARGSILVFHDGDVCAPANYAAEVVEAIEGRGFTAASLQRFLFYLNPTDTQSVYENGEIAAPIVPSLVYQNWKGGTIAVARDAFFTLGGFDEGFVDWGGEDDEFYDRCAALGHQRAGYLPFVHLWHPPQADRKATDNPNIIDVMPWRIGMKREARIAELAARRFGDVCAPDPLYSYKSQRSESA